MNHSRKTLQQMSLASILGASSLQKFQRWQLVPITKPWFVSFFGGMDHHDTVLPHDETTTTESQTFAPIYLATITHANEKKLLELGV